MKIGILSSLLATAAIFLPGAPSLAKTPEHADPLTLRVATERGVVYREGPREVVVQVELQARRPDNAKHSPLNVAVVLDRSGSMAGAKLEKARQAACVALDKMADDDIFSLVIYDQEAELLVPPAKVGGESHREAIKERIERIRPGGSTALHAGVQLGAKQIRTHLADERVNRIVLLSDGLANVGPSTPAALAALGVELGKDHMSVTTIGLGDDFNENLMTALAEASHANYYYVQDAEKLPGIFADELGSVASKIAADVTVRIEVPEGVRLKEILGHPEIKCEDRHAQIALPEIFGAEHRLYHVRCAVADAKPEEIAVANVAMNYEDTASKQRLSQNGAASVRLTDDRSASEKSVADGVAQQVTIVENRLAKEAAARLVDEGRTKEAAKVMQDRIIANNALPAARQVPNVADENRKLKSWSDAIGTNGVLDKSGTKSLKWENYQDKYQKR